MCVKAGQCVKTYLYNVNTIGVGQVALKLCLVVLSYAPNAELTEFAIQTLPRTFSDPFHGVRARAAVR